MKDYNDLVPPLALPIGGKTYTIPPVSARLGLTMQTDIEALASWDGVRMYQEFLGETYDEMMADGVALGALDRAFLAALADYQVGRDRAEMVWEQGADPDFLERVRAMAQNKGLLVSPRSTSTAAAPKTRTPASGRTTRSRQATQPSKRKTAAKASPGRRSSTSGRS